MKTMKLLLIALCTIFSVHLTAQVSFGQSEKINDNWKFTLNDVKDAQMVSYNDKRWQTLDVPHDRSVIGRLRPTLASATGYRPGGIVWYRETLQITQDCQREI